MARRTAKKGAEGLGIAALVLLGLSWAGVKATISFVQENAQAVLGIVVLGFGACALLIAVRRRRHGEQGSIPPPATSVPPERISRTLHTIPASSPTAIPPRTAVPDGGTEPAFRISAIIDEPATMRSRGFGKAEVRTRMRTPARWVPPGEAVDIQGVRITSGLFWLGASLASNHWQGEKCAVDPSLPVAKPGTGSALGMPYWPSWQTISPAARRAWLDWMAGGRSDPAADIGLVFLFFYGLEYRLLKAGAREDAPHLIAEVERLLAIHNGNDSFRRYAENFLAVARLLLPGRVPRPRLSLRQYGSGEIPLDIRAHLGRKLAVGEALDANDALIWVTALPDASLRTPAIRCEEEFRQLWEIRFAEKYPKGLTVSAPKPRLNVRYRAASGTFEVAVEGEHSNWPDIAAVSAPTKKLRVLIEACTEELEPLSRFVGKNPDARTSAGAALLLPPALHSPGLLDGLAAPFEPLFAANRTAATTPRHLFELAGIPIPKAGRAPTNAFDQLARIMDLVGIAVEPDRRYGGTAPAPDATVFVFKAPGGAPVDAERPEYRAVRTVTEVSLIAAASDGPMTEAEVEVVLEEIRSAEALGPLEKARLMAYATALHGDPPKQQAVLRKLGSRPVSERELIARSALAAVLADGHARPEEVRFLERLHKALGLGADEVYSAIHRGSVIVDDASPQAPARAMQVAKPTPGGAIEIDPIRLARLRRETQAVSGLLSEIFLDDADPTSRAPAVAARPSPAATDEAFDGLDAPHARLLEQVLRSGTLARGDYEGHARSLSLLPEGALETINEWAFERFDEALIEDGEAVTIVPHLRERFAPATKEAR